MLDIADRFDALGPLLERIADVSPIPLALALLLQLLKLGAMSRAWHCILQSAYPHSRIRARDTVAPYIAGVGINAVVPAKAGFLARAVLVKKRIPGSTYETITGTVVMETCLGVVPVIVLVAIATATGIVPAGTAWSALTPGSVAHPPAAVVVALVTAGLALGLAAAWVPPARARVGRIVRRLGQGAAIVRHPAALGHALLALTVSWGLRLACICAFLVAFGVDASPRTVLLVVLVQILSALIPLAPNGAGAQQGLMVLALAGTAPSGTILAFAIGMQAAIALVDVVAAAAALAVLGVPRGALRELRRPLPEAAPVPAAT
jgi:uncharacterized membrane protein YbhN (UPF0104 family)